jgi:hypothetical protein
MSFAFNFGLDLAVLDAPVQRKIALRDPLKEEEEFAATVHAVHADRTLKRQRKQRQAAQANARDKRAKEAQDALDALTPKERKERETRLHYQRKRRERIKHDACSMHDLLWYTDPLPYPNVMDMGLAAEHMVFAAIQQDDQLLGTVRKTFFRQRADLVVMVGSSQYPVQVKSTRGPIDTVELEDGSLQIVETGTLKFVVKQDYAGMAIVCVDMFSGGMWVMDYATCMALQARSSELKHRNCILLRPSEAAYVNMRVQPRELWSCIAGMRLDTQHDWFTYKMSRYDLTAKKNADMARETIFCEHCIATLERSWTHPNTYTVAGETFHIVIIDNMSNQNSFHIEARFIVLFSLRTSTAFMVENTVGRIHAHNFSINPKFVRNIDTYALTGCAACRK